MADDQKSVRRFSEEIEKAVALANKVLARDGRAAMWQDENGELCVAEIHDVKEVSHAIAS